MTEPVVQHKLYCITCKSTEKPLHKANLNRTKTSTIRYYRCNECEAKRLRKYRATKSGADAAYRAILKYQKSNSERVKAWGKAQRKYSLKPCEMCGEKRTDRHHPNIEEPLNIVFLCRVHHKAAHKVEALLAD